MRSCGRDPRRRSSVPRPLLARYSRHELPNPPCPRVGTSAHLIPTPGSKSPRSCDPSTSTASRRTNSRPPSADASTTAPAWTSQTLTKMPPRAPPTPERRATPNAARPPRFPPPPPRPRPRSPRPAGALASPFPKSTNSSRTCSSRCSRWVLCCASASRRAPRTSCARASRR